ncbi:uncharacterized protein LOC142476927 isoform X2 [Ascaphus truei]|uniref:uncharacterized protein LOC142476927 isoform X2 n=1 Tax=Ascaphus truei TaxID=8439 RepID=UPI003F597BF6
METGGIGASRGRRKGEGGRCRSLAPGKEEKAGKWGRTSDAVRDNMGTVKGSVDTGKETPRRRFAPPATKAVRFPERGGKSGDAGREEEEEVVAGERGAELEKRTGAAIEKKKREDRGSLSDAQYEEIFEVVLGRSSLALFKMAARRHMTPRCHGNGTPCDVAVSRCHGIAGNHMMKSAAGDKHDIKATRQQKGGRRRQDPASEPRNRTPQPEPAAAPEVTSGNAERAAGRVLTSATNGGNAKHRLKRSVPRRGKVT